MEAIGIGVAIIVLSAAILGGCRWLWKHREALAQKFREQACRQHQWEPINKPGDTAWLVTSEDEWCVKCGARR